MVERNLLERSCRAVVVEFAVPGKVGKGNRVPGCVRPVVAMTQVVVFRCKSSSLLVTRSTGETTIDRQATFMKKHSPELKALLCNRLSLKVVGRCRKACGCGKRQRRTTKAVPFPAAVECCREKKHGKEEASQDRKRSHPTNLIQKRSEER